MPLIKYHKVKAGQGISLIAEIYQGSIGGSYEQRASLLYLLNHDAFEKGNINHLIKGRTLRVPTKAEINNYSLKEAKSTFSRLIAQHRSKPVSRPVAATKPEPVAKQKIQPQTEAVVKVVQKSLEILAVRIDQNKRHFAKELKQVKARVGQYAEEFKQMVSTEQGTNRRNQDVVLSLVESLIDFAGKQEEQNTRLMAEIKVMSAKFKTSQARVQTLASRVDNINPQTPLADLLSKAMIATAIEPLQIEVDELKAQFSRANFAYIDVVRAQLAQQIELEQIVDSESRYENFMLGAVMPLQHDIAKIKQSLGTDLQLVEDSHNNRLLLDSTGRLISRKYFAGMVGVAQPITANNNQNIANSP